MSSKTEIINALKGILEIESVMSSPKTDAPFGEGCKKALDYYLDLAKSMGFSVYNCDGYAGHIDYGESEKTVGALVHLDVVPASADFSTPPFKMTVVGDKVIARGAMDDKGPAIATLFALKELKEKCEKTGKKLKSKIRIIAGVNEENGSKCISYYKTKNKMPDIAFSPDADFPLINCEKSIVGYKISLNRNEIFNKYIENIKGGKAHNAVPDYAECTLKEGVAVNDKTVIPEGVSLEKIDGKIVIKAKGKSAHSMEAEKGVNAILRLVCAVKSLVIGLKDEESLNWIVKRMGDSVRGEALGAAYFDEISGANTVNFVYISLGENTVDLLLDMRVPVTCKIEEMEENIKAKLPKEGALNRINYAPYLFVSEDSFLVKTLLAVYAEKTGEKNPKPLVTGGGTYARTMPNCVAFGATFPNERHNIHGDDEYITLTQIDRLIDIYCAAFEKLSEVE